MNQTEPYSSVEFLQSRVAYLEECYLRYMEILDVLASSSKFLHDLTRSKNSKSIFDSTLHQVKRFLDCSGVGCLELRDDHGFHMATCEPQGYQTVLNREIDSRIIDGTFAWALHRNQAVLSPMEEGKTFLLQVIETRSRIRGMFVAILDGEMAKIDTSALSALAIALNTCAYALESATLYPMLREHLVTLENRVAERTRDIESARAAAEVSRGKFELLSNNIDAHIWSVSDSHTYDSLNQAHADFFGYSREEMEGESLYVFLPKEVADHLVHGNRKTFQEKCQLRSEEWLPDRSGEKRLFAITRTPKIGHEGSVHYVICHGIDITETKRMEKELRFLSNVDPLTSAFNRRYLEDALAKEIERARRYGLTFSVAMLDIDHFKQINDTFGHAAGDEVLKGIVACVNGRIRNSDVFARWGGEEFLLLLVGTSLGPSRIVADDILENIRASRFGSVERVTASLGLTEYRSNDTLDALIKRADTLVYAAKTAGRDCVIEG